MQFKFDADQDCQLQAIAAVVDLFRGQRRAEFDFTSPERLGQYVLVDYVSSKRKRVGRGSSPMPGGTPAR